MPKIFEHLHIPWEDVEARVRSFQESGVIRGDRYRGVYIPLSQNTPLTRDDEEEIYLTNRASYDAASSDYHSASLAHDVAEHHEAFLNQFEAGRRLRLLDVGCGTGRDLKELASKGHDVTGLEGSPRMADLARAFSGCRVLEQNLLDLVLPDNTYDGVFANASLFHVPHSSLPKTLAMIRKALKPGGVLFTCNPLGDDCQGWAGGRFVAFHSPEKWNESLSALGFENVQTYYRPREKPPKDADWLATVWRRK